MIGGWGWKCGPLLLRHLSPCLLPPAHRLWPALTVRENLTYAAKMYLGPQPADTRAKLVDALLADLGLETCADVVWV